MRMTASWSGPHGPTEYKVVARCSVPDGKLPSDRRPDRVKRDVVLRAVKVWPGQGGACGKIGATANLDGSCARRGEQRARRDEETAVRSNKETDEGEKMRCAGENPLTKNTPYKACLGFTQVTARRIAQPPIAALSRGFSPSGAVAAARSRKADAEGRVQFIRDNSGTASRWNPPISSIQS